MTHLLFVFLVVGLLPYLVSAHGYIGSVTISGQVYTGNIPGGTTNPSIIRQVSTISPVKGATNPSINCGMNSTMASDVANVNPGTQILVHWVGGATGQNNWPHEVGPIMHYMTKCSGSCSSYDSTNAEWFKISELGVITPQNTSWYQGDIEQGQPANVTIPSNIEPGEYLLRSELISLQNAMSMGGAEFYPGCVQLNIGGSGTGAPQSDEVCQFPDCYSDSNPGIYDPNVYNPPLTYVFPGPPVASFVGNGAAVGGSQPSGTAVDSSATTTASSSPTASASSVPADTSSPSPSPTSPAVSPTVSPTASPTASPTSSAMVEPTPVPSSVNPTTTNSNPGPTCYVTRSTTGEFAKRGEAKKIHKRRLVRHGSK